MKLYLSLSLCTIEFSGNLNDPNEHMMEHKEAGASWMSLMYMTKEA